jgi:hypothetical protein
LHEPAQTAYASRRRIDSGALILEILRRLERKVSLGLGALILQFRTHHPNQIDA